MCFCYLGSGVWVWVLCLTIRLLTALAGEAYMLYLYLDKTVIRHKLFDEWKALETVKASAQETFKRGVKNLGFRYVDN